MRQKIFLLFALLCAIVQGALAQDEWDAVYTMTQTKQSDWTALSASSTTGRTLGSAGNTTFYYVTSNLSFTNATAGGSGLTILGTVYLYVPEGKTLTCTGANADGRTGAGAGIELAAGNSLYILGCGTLNANGGNAANGRNGASGGASVNEYPTDHVCSGTGGTGGNGGGGAGAGIGTRGGNGGTGGNGGAGHDRTGDGWDKANGNSGSAGTNGGTAGAMGNLYLYQALAPTMNVNGGSQGSAGTSGPGGKSQIWDGYLNWSVPAGGGGGAGGFGGAASSIGTGGPGGGGGGGGAGGGLDWKNNGYYYLCSPGGQGGQNADGSNASDGHQAEVSPTALGNGMCGSNGSWDSDDCSYSGAAVSNGTGGGRGAAGSANVGGSYGTVTLDWTTQEDDWSLICLRTGTTRADWVHLADGGTAGKTLGTAGTTTYYYTAYDRTFSNSNAGGSGLTILGTVYLYIPSGKTITCTGANASGTTGAGAGIELTEGNTLYLIGSGSLVATGGNAANGGNGAGGGDAGWDGIRWSGSGGNGGNGGGGAGAGIGTRGGNGGDGGAGGEGIQKDLGIESTGNVGGNGSVGGTAAGMGTLYIYEGSSTVSPQTNIHGGSQGTSGGNGGAGGRHALEIEYNDEENKVLHIWTMGGGGGGAGGGFGGAACSIGTGGPGGGGGGGGASGSIQSRNAEASFYKVGAFGGNPGVNGDGTTAGSGANTEMNSTENLSHDNMMAYYGYYCQGWQDGDNRAAGGSGGGTGSVSVSGSANAVTAGWPTQGLGIEGNPYIVSSTADWNTFAGYVNGGHTFSGEFVKLGANVSVTDMAGTGDANSFQGTFDGDGQTLTFTNGTAQTPFDEDYCAPFRHVKGAVIKNLHVDGTIYTSKQKAAGFVGESHGALSIINCRSSINITGSKSGDGTFGGFVATLSGAGNTIVIDGCLFDGSFATTNGTRNCGGFIGWPVYNRPVITNSLMKPSSVGAGMLSNTFSRWHTGYEPTITNCYYVATTNLPTDQGTEAVATATAPANLGSLVEDYGMVKAYANGILVGGTYYVAPATVTLADNADNSTAISGANGYVADVTLSGRTLYKDGAWNTICLPFDVTIAGSPLAGATARALESASISGSTLTLTFGDAVTTLEAGTPYIIKWTADANYVDDDEHNIVSPVFSGVTIDADADGSYDTETASPAVTTDERVRFLGTYKSTAFDAEDKSILLMGGGNALYYPTTGAGIGAQRAYFKIGDDAVLARQLTAFNIDFGDDEATGIISIENGKLTIDNASDAWYSLDGRKLQGKPSVKGVYVNNGRKVVIK